MSAFDRTSYKNRGITGLANLGNTCFLNSCVQALSHTYELSEYLVSDKCKSCLKSDLPDAVITKEWNDLREIMWKNNGTVSPNRYVYFIQQLASQKDRELFTGWAQNDMPEFLLFIIECMHNSVSRSITMKITGKVENHVDQIATECYKMLQTIYNKEYSEIMELFYGIYVSELTTMDGKTSHTIKPETYFMLDLPIPPKKGANLIDCFDAFTSSEIMDGDNAWFNEKTGKKEDVKKRITFWNIPKILVVTLKRFSPDGKRKIQDVVDFPLENLDLSKYVSGYNQKQYVYDLYAVCNHSGGPQGGHYTAFVKTASGEWVHFNDTNVERNVNPAQIVTAKAYCLFLRGNPR
jgi:ubiquitin carboxyl-terminal hydrolase 8